MSNYKVFYRSVKSADTHHRVNEDCYMHVQYYMMNDAKINVLAVADGMGGLSNGETASRSAVAGALESVHRELLRRYQDSRGKNFSMTHHIEWLEPLPGQHWKTPMRLYAPQRNPGWRQELH